MKFFRVIWEFLNSKVGLLLLGFSLTTVLGGLLADRMHQRSWERQSAIEHRRQVFEWERSRKFELLRLKLNEGQQSLEEISDLINLRFFRLHKVFENALTGNFADAKTNWREYMNVVERWNVKLIIYQNKLERLVNRNIATQFNNYETDNPNLTNPTSLHGHFFISHVKVKSLLECAKKPSCSITKDMERDANKSLRNLDIFSDAFVDRVSQLFLDRTFELEEFKSIVPANKANEADVKKPGGLP